MAFRDELVVIIPTFGRAALLHRCLTALLVAGMPANGIVVVDDASDDAAVVSVAQEIGVRFVSLARNSGPAGARNAGVAATGAGGILFFVDSDVLVAPDVLTRLEIAFADPALDAVFGCYDDKPAETNLVSLYVNLRHREVHRQCAGPAETFWAGCGAVRRAAFEAVGGFDPSSRWHYIEDVELGRRLDRAGFKIQLDPTLQGKHLKHWSLVKSAQTDILFRALPWVALMLEETRVMRGLNADKAGRLSMLSIIAVIACALLAFWWPPALIPMIAFLVAIPWLNRPLFRSFIRNRSLGFAAACVPLHAFHLGCVGLGLALGTARHALGTGRGRRKSAKIQSRT